MKLKIKKLHPDAIIPSYAHEGDAGMDLFAPERVELLPGERKSIPLGLSMEIPYGYVILLWDKSGISHKFGLKSFGGVVDSGYRGEVCAGIMNLSDKPYVFEKGNKVIQMLIQKVEEMEVEEVDGLSESMRGAGGFGSTGK